jgi:hypothetical protein
VRGGGCGDMHFLDFIILDGVLREKRANAKRLRANPHRTENLVTSSLPLSSLSCI